MKRILKSLKEIINSKAFLGAFLFAIALWIYTSLNSEYTIFKKIPIKITLPSDRAISSEVPKTISIQLKSNGWHLLNLFLINRSIECNINLSEEKILDSINITKKELLKGTSNLSHITVLDYVPESFTFSTGKIFENAVPIKSNIEVNPTEGFIVVGDIILHPDMVVLKGDYNLIKDIRNWPTEKVVFNNHYENFEANVNLSDSLNHLIALSEYSVTANINIQQLAERTFYDIPIKIKGGVMPQRHKLFPPMITVTIRGGIEQLFEFNPEMISAFINFDDLIKDSTGLIIPNIKLPKNIKLVNTYPKIINHRIIDFLTSN